MVMVSSDPDEPVSEVMADSGVLVDGVGTSAAGAIALEGVLSSCSSPNVFATPLTERDNKLGCKS